MHALPLCFNPSPKTHKTPDELGDPKSRPVVQASSCVTFIPGETLTEILNAALMAYPNQYECLSTEEMLAKVDKANKVIRDQGVGSGDATALYPSLRHDESVRLCKDVILNCPGEFNNVDSKDVAIFIATNCSQNEISQSGLTKLIPARRHSRGKIPDEITTRLLDDAFPSKFMPTKECTTQETRLLLSKVVEVDVRLVIKNHIYSWKDELYLQQVGVPTGLSLSGVIGRISMDHWRVSTAALMAENKMTCYLLEKYVDDSELVTENLPMGTRWDGTRLVTTEDKAYEDIDAGKSKEEVIMSAWGAMASSIIPGLQFTVDYPNSSNNNKVPMLDFSL